MRDIHRPVLALAWTLAAASWAMPPGAHADVTVQQNMSFDVAIIKAHGTNTEYTTADKQRRDSSTQCEGWMKMLCGNTQSGEIIRLDKDLSWALDPDKKSYRETRFMTEAERKELQARAQAMLDKLKECPTPAAQQSQGPDVSKCQMSPPKTDVKQTDEHSTFAGHDARKSVVTITQSCKNPDSGDVCDMVFSFDSWLTQDQIEGLDQRRAFEMAYAKKLGLTDNPALAKQLQGFLAPYAGTLKDLQAKSADLKGYPLKTTFRVLFGGEHCASAKGQQSAGGGGNSVLGDASSAAGQAAASSSQNEASNAASEAIAQKAGSSPGGNVIGSAANAFSSKLIGGLFQKKAAPAPAPAAPGASGGGAGAAPGLIQAAQMTVETTAITTGSVPASQFDIPAGWKLVVPKPTAQKDEEFSCPKTGG
jgi:hypothetical protein